MLQATDAIPSCINLVGKETMVPSFSRRFGGVSLSITFEPEHVFVTHTTLFKNDSTATSYLLLNQHTQHQLRQSLLLLDVEELVTQTPLVPPIKLGATPAASLRYLNLAPYYRRKALIKLAKMTFTLRDELEAGNLTALGVSLHHQWQIQKQLTPSLHASAVDSLTRKLRRAGALGSKLIIFRDRRFLLVFCPPENVSAVKDKLTKLSLVPYQYATV